jgi:thymidylate synthase
LQFTPAFIDAINLNEAYFMLLSQCWEHGIKYEITEGSNKGGYRLELPFAAGFIHNPHMRPLAPTMPISVPPTTTDDKIQEYFINYLMDSTLSTNEEYRYSTWINKKMENWEADEKSLSPKMESQLDWCIRHFKEKGHGNNHCHITIGEPGGQFVYDQTYTNDTNRRTSPCLRGIDIKIKNDQIILGVMFRSWDLYAGFPENMGGFALLNQYIAEQVGAKEGPLTFASQGLHCYDYQLSSLSAYLRKE